MNYANREAYIQTLLTDLKLLESRVDTLKQIIFEKNVRIFEKNVRIAELEADGLLATLIIDEQMGYQLIFNAEEKNCRVVMTSAVFPDNKKLTFIRRE